MSKYRTSVKRIGSTEIPLKIELIQVTTPHGTIPTVRVKRTNGVLYASVPLSQLPPDVQELFS